DADHDDRADAIEQRGGMRPARLLAPEILHAGGVPGLQPSAEVRVSRRRHRRRGAHLVKSQAQGPGLQTVGHNLEVHRDSTGRSVLGPWSSVLPLRYSCRAWVSSGTALASRMSWTGRGE